MNIWAMIIGALLLFINGGNDPIIYTGYINEVSYNLFQLFLIAGGVFCVVYGVFGLLTACIVSILHLIYYMIIRFKNEHFEWR